MYLSNEKSLCENCVFNITWKYCHVVPDGGGVACDAPTKDKQIRIISPRTECVDYLDNELI